MKNVQGVNMEAVGANPAYYEEDGSRSNGLECYMAQIRSAYTERIVEASEVTLHGLTMNDWLIFTKTSKTFFREITNAISITFAKLKLKFKILTMF